MPQIENQDESHTEEPPSEMDYPSGNRHTDNLDILATILLRRDIVFRRHYRPSGGLPSWSGGIKCGVLSHLMDYFA